MHPQLSDRRSLPTRRVVRPAAHPSPLTTLPRRDLTRFGSGEIPPGETPPGETPAGETVAGETAAGETAAGQEERVVGHPREPRPVAAP